MEIMIIFSVSAVNCHFEPYYFSLYPFSLGS
jgi:hypothetical protein